MAKMIAKTGGATCTCNMGSAFFGAILCAAALFFLVKGWMMQTGQESWIMTYIWYLVGVILGMAGCMFKKKGMNCQKCCGV